MCIRRSRSRDQDFQRATATGEQRNVISIFLAIHGHGLHFVRDEPAGPESSIRPIETIPAPAIWSEPSKSADREPLHEPAQRWRHHVRWRGEPELLQHHQASTERAAGRTWIQQRIAFCGIAGSDPASPWNCTNVCHRCWRDFLRPHGADWTSHFVRKSRRLFPWSSTIEVTFQGGCHAPLGSVCPSCDGDR